MKLRIALIATVLSAGACKTKAEKLDEQGGELRGQVYESVCRLYVEEACVEQMSTEGCGFLSFESVSDCKALASLGADCDDELDIAIAEAEAAIDDCIEAIDAFECGGAEPICVNDGDAYIYNFAGCAEANEIFAEHCQSDSGG